MNTIATLLLLAALLPIVAAGAAKAGGKGFNNNSPRTWLSQQEGWRARANAAQANTFESLPFFFAASLYAVYHQAELVHLGGLMSAWLLLRLFYLGAYLANRGTVRSLIWLAALAVNIAILFAG